MSQTRFEKTKKKITLLYLLIEEIQSWLVFSKLVEKSFWQITNSQFISEKKFTKENSQQPVNLLVHRLQVQCDGECGPATPLKYYLKIR